MEMCCMCCCPQPHMSVIRPRGTAGKLRNWVRNITIGEVFICILHMMIFDIMSGLTHAISVWIDFMAYSTMQWVQAMVMIIIAGIDLGMMLFSWSKSDTYKAVINSHWLSQSGYWVIISFFIIKIVVGCMAFAVWRTEFRKEHGHADCCRPVVPPFIKDGGSGNQSAMLNTDRSDEETGMRRTGGGAGPLPFQGTGVSIGGGGGGSGYGFNQNPDLYAQPRRSQVQTG